MEQRDKLNVLILEDSAERISCFTELFINSNMIVTNCAKTAILFLNSYKFDTIFLDHDLGGEAYVDVNRKDTGSEVCREINELNMKSQIIIHSWNDTGAEYMRSTLVNKGFTRVQKCTFDSNLLTSIEESLK